jgi:hypothetical protein
LSAKAVKTIAIVGKTQIALRAGLAPSRQRAIKAMSASVFIDYPGLLSWHSTTVNSEIHAPMSGVRDSGWGRTGPDSLKEFPDIIWINSRSDQRQYPI